MVQVVMNKMPLPCGAKSLVKQNELDTNKETDTKGKNISCGVQASLGNTSQAAQNIGPILE